MSFINNALYILLQRITNFKNMTKITYFCSEGLHILQLLL